MSTITAYAGAPVMKLWPALADCARLLTPGGGGETLFFYDTGAVDAGTAGAEKPALVLIHGLGDEADSWRSLVPLLRDTYRVIAPDLPGFGRSVAPGRINLARHIRAVLRLLEESGAASPENPAILAGNSMGTMIAEGAAFERPDLTRDLVLIDGGFPAALKADPALLLLCIPGIGNRGYRKYRRDHEGAYRSLFPYYTDFPALPETDREFLRERVIARVESPTQERAYFDSFRSLVWAQGVGASRLRARFISYVNSPGKRGTVHLIWGEHDRILPPETAAPVRALCPEADFTLIAGAGHLPHQERPVETAAAILAALRRRADGAG